MGCTTTGAAGAVGSGRTGRSVAITVASGERSDSLIVFFPILTFSSPVIGTAPSIFLPSTNVPFVEFRSRSENLPSAPVSIVAWCEDASGSDRTRSDSGWRPIVNVSPVASIGLPLSGPSSTVIHIILTPKSTAPRAARRRQSIPTTGRAQQT